jgi:hypothetical protein
MAMKKRRRKRHDANVSLVQEAPRRSFAGRVRGHRAGTGKAPCWNRKGGKG